MDTDPISEYKKISEVAKEREERQIMRYTEYICAFQIVHDLIPDFFQYNFVILNLVLSFLYFLDSTYGEL